MSTMLITAWIVVGLTLYIGIGTAIFMKILATNEGRRLVFKSQSWELKVGITILSVLLWWLLLIPPKKGY